MDRIIRFFGFPVFTAGIPVPHGFLLVVNGGTGRFGTCEMDPGKGRFTFKNDLFSRLPKSHCFRELGERDRIGYKILREGEVGIIRPVSDDHIIWRRVDKEVSLQIILRFLGNAAVLPVAAVMGQNCQPVDKLYGRNI